jgi:tetratricopeptide (TPR) repeat protein
VLSGISVVLTIIAQRAGGAIQSFEHYPLEDRLLVSVRALGFYLLNMVWPSGLVPFYPYPSKISFFHQEFFLSFLTITIITILCILKWKKQKVWAVAWGYYVITLLPVLGIVKVGGQAAADRYTYLPSLGPFLILGLGVTVLARKVTGKWQCSAKRKVLVIMSIVSITIVLSYSTINQIKIWKDGLTLWAREVTVFPQSEKGYTSLGIAYYEKGQVNKAIAHLKNAIRLNPNYANAHFNLGVVYQSQGLINEAIKEYRISIEIIPNHISAHNNLGLSYFLQGNVIKAIEHYKVAIRINPNYPNAHDNLGNAYQSQGLINRAIKEYETVLKINPNSPEANNNLGNVYAKLNRIDKAIQQYQVVLRIQPDFALAHYNLGLRYLSKDLFEKSIQHFHMFLKSNPYDAEAHYYIGVAYRSQGLKKKANEHFRIAGELNPALFDKKINQQ